LGFWSFTYYQQPGGGLALNEISHSFDEPLKALPFHEMAGENDVFSLRQAQFFWRGAAWDKLLHIRSITNHEN